MNSMITNEKHLTHEPLSRYQFRLSDIEKKMPEDISSIWQESAGRDFIRVMAELDCYTGPNRQISKEQLTVNKDGSDLLEMLCRRLEAVADNPWNGYDRIQFIRFIPAQ